MKNKKKELNTKWVLAEQRLPWEEGKVLLMKKHWGYPRVGKYSKDTFLVDGVVINNTLEDPVFWLKIDSYEFIQKDEWNYVKYDKCDVCKKQIEELEDIPISTNFEKIDNINGAINFRGSGHYHTNWDLQNIELTICDGCLDKIVDKNKTEFYL